MRFMLLIKSDAKTEAGKLPDPAVFEAMNEYNQALIDAGAMVAGEGLKASKEGVRLYQEDGKKTRVNGPFPNPESVVAGFWIIDAKDKAEAVAWAKKMPFEATADGATRGEIEVRPFWEFPGQEPGGKRGPTPAGQRAFACWVGADEVSERGEFPEDPTLFEEMGKLIGALTAEGKFGTGDGLRPSKDGARVVFTPGKREVIDGPFAETKELVAGFTTLYAKDLEEAVALGWRFLAVDAPGRGGKSWCEIRPCFEESDFA